MFKTHVIHLFLLALLAAAPAVGQQVSSNEPTTDQWIELLSHREARQRAQAAQALGNLGPKAAEAVGALTDTLGDADSDVRLDTATALGRIGAPAVGAIAPLTDTLQDDNEYVRYAARWALGKIAAGLTDDDLDMSEPELIGRAVLLSLAEKALRKTNAPETADRLAAARAPVDARLAKLVAIREKAAAEAAARAEAEANPDAVMQVLASDAVGRFNARLERLVRELHEPDSFRRLRAVHELSQMGNVAVPALIEALRAEPRINEEQPDSIDITTAIFYALGRIGGPAAPELAKALDGSDAAHRVSFTLGKIGPDAITALPVLIEIVENTENDEPTRSLAIEAIGDIGPRAKAAVPVLIGIARDLDNVEVELRCTALRSLGKIGEAALEATPHLIKMLSNCDDYDAVRWHAASTLPLIGAPADQAVPALLALFDDRNKNEAVLRDALRALASYGEEARAAVPVFVETLSLDDVHLASVAAKALAEIGGTPEEAIGPLMRLSGDVYPDVQEAVAAVLADIGPPAINELIERLGSTDDFTRTRAAAMLARIGPAGAAAVGPMIELLRDKDAGWARRYALIGLGEFGSAEAIDDLLAVLRDDSEDRSLRGMAATALGRLGDVALPAAAYLVELLHDEHAPGNVRAMCALAAVKISPDAIPAVLRALRTDDPLVRIAAARAMHDAAILSKHALPALLDCGEREQAGFLAAEVMSQIGPDAVRFLLDTIRDEQLSVETRRAAADLVGDLYFDDDLHREVAPVLIDALRDEQLRDAAAFALSNLGEESIPAMLATLDEAERQGDSKSEFCELLRSLTLELCMPTGRGAASLGFDDITGFDAYDDLALYNLRAAAGERSVESMAEEAAPVVDEPQPETAAPIEEGVEPPPAADTPAGFETVKVFYGTNRRPESGSAAAPVKFDLFLPAAIAGLATMIFGFFGHVRTRSATRAAMAFCGLMATVALAYGSYVSLARRANETAKAGPKYGTEHSDIVEMGVCEVTIPKTHEMGRLEGPSMLKFEVVEDPLKHIVLRCVERHNPDEFFGDLRSELNRRGDSILVFIHGYNVTFNDAARRTAQMAHDLEFAGAPMFYSWPSQGSWYRYREDEKHVELAVDHLKKFLVDVARRSGAGSIHLIAHSMGNRVLTGALKEIEVEAGKQGAMFNQVVLAAPDINADIFKHRIAPAIVTKAERVTLYASSKDLALTASRVFNSGGARAGDTSDGPLVVPGIETIDVTDVDNGLGGHVYYGSNRAILEDLKQLLAESRSADERRLLDAVAHGDDTYWVCRRLQLADRATASAAVRH